MNPKASSTIGFKAPGKLVIYIHNSNLSLDLGIHNSESKKVLTDLGNAYLSAFENIEKGKDASNPEIIKQLLGHGFLEVSGGEYNITEQGRDAMTSLEWW